MIKSHRIKLKYHVIFWSIYFFFNVIRWGSYFNDYQYSLKSNLVEFPLHMIITYTTIYYLIPNYIATKKFIQFLIYFGLLLGGIYFLRTGLNYIFVSKNLWPEADGIHQAYTFNHVVAVIIGEVYVVALASAIKLTYDWGEEKRKNNELLQLQTKTELDFLKSQIQPHFFFNTLNNLYALTIMKSDNAPEVVVKLSDMMQYVLYEVNNPFVDILKEINYIQAYIELEELRFGDKVKTDISLIGDFSGIQVPPLILLTFVENCFKHGARNSDKLKISITFESKKDTIYFNVANTIDGTPKKKTNHGIGLENVKRRLDLIYGKKYNLSTKIENHKYIVNLELSVI
ncbi:sensor histidine kinase [Namhaeicola litoreus]|uniref:Sensor histidine kinase n=1 Tax=Namhaeicola litoreus TaxID=1052145 RepID=A0ABW3Y546_9FLAO